MYSVDTSVLITAWRDHYWPDVFPGFWEKFNDAVDAGILQAIDPVKGELTKRDDDVARWAKARPNFFVPLDPDIQAATADVLRTHPGLITAGGKRSTVDPFVIGLGIARGFPVVTYERASNSVAKPHIPNVCIDKGHAVFNMEQLARALGWKFNA